MIIIGIDVDKWTSVMDDVSFHCINIGQMMTDKILSLINKQGRVSFKDLSIAFPNTSLKILTYYLDTLLTDKKIIDTPEGYVVSRLKSPETEII